MHKRYHTLRNLIFVQLWLLLTLGFPLLGALVNYTSGKTLLWLCTFFVLPLIGLLLRSQKKIFGGMLLFFYEILLLAWILLTVLRIPLLGGAQLLTAFGLFTLFGCSWYGLYLTVRYLRRMQHPWKTMMEQ